MNEVKVTTPTIDRALCVGHGRCYTLAPDLFAPDDDGHSVVIGVAGSPEADRRLISARRNCPEGAVGAAPTT